MTIVIYQRTPAKQIRKEAKESIQKIEDWFKDNPKRRVCHAQTWYDRMTKVRRKHVTEDVNAAVEEAIK